MSKLKKLATNANKRSGRPSIPDKVILQLCIDAGGRCEYATCNKMIWTDPLTFSKVNRSYVAHIVGVNKDSARYDASCAKRLATQLSNLMLLCDSCHRRVDRDEKDLHPRDRLEKMKSEHETRIRTLTGISSDRKTLLVSYSTKIESQLFTISYEQAAEAVVPNRYPLEPSVTNLGVVNLANRASDPQFWAHESSSLKNAFSSYVRQRIDRGSAPHLSIFAAAPQPLLVLLGSLVSDITPADTFQPKREKVDPEDRWKWQETTLNTPNDFHLVEPIDRSGLPVLIVSLSASVPDDDVTKVVAGASIWCITCTNPHNDMLRTRSQLSDFRSLVRQAFDRIKLAHGSSSSIHVFPVMPASCAVEFGRVYQPRADLPLRLFDRISPATGFVEVLTVSADSTR